MQKQPLDGAAQSAGAVALTEKVARHLAAAKQQRPLLVAIDGPDASGKTTFADRLADACRMHGQHVTRIEADDFENPRQVRYQQGRNSPKGFFEDTYDHEALRAKVLLPLTIGDRRIVRRIYDRATDVQVVDPTEEVRTDGVVIIDGCFLLRRMLRELWTFRILLEVTTEERLRRATTRDVERLGGIEGVVDRYRNRYLPGYDLYLEREDPYASADLIIENSDVTTPKILSWDQIVER